jgi:hypothetical protein
MSRPCPEIQLLLTEFAADELDPAAAEQVAAHVARCADCRQDLADEMVLRRSLATLPVQVGPAVVRPTAPRARRRAGWRPVLGGLVAAALAIAVLLPDHAPNAPQGPSLGPYTPAQVAQARMDVRTSLALTARILEKTERHTVVDVFGRQLPQAVSGPLRSAAATPEGG